MKKFIALLLFAMIIILNSSTAWSATSTITSTKRGYVTSTGIGAGYYSNMAVGMWDAHGGSNPIYRGFSFFDIPSAVRNGTITSAKLTVTVASLPEWNSLLNFVDLRTLGNTTSAEFVGLADNYARYFVLDGDSFQDYITKSSAKEFYVYPIDLSGKSEIGFSFKASPEDSSGTMDDDSNYIILNNPTLVITYTPATPSITVSSPNGGESLQRGNTKCL
jgi:hypothetical protein